MHGDEERAPSPLRFFAEAVLISVPLLLGWIVLRRVVASCPSFPTDAQFAGSSERFRLTSSAMCSLGDARRILAVDSAFAVLQAAGVGVLVYRWHGPKTWRSEPGRSRIGRMGLVAMAALGGFIDLLENALTSLGLRSLPDGIGLADRHALAVTVLAWPKWVFTGSATTIAVLLGLAWVGRLGESLTDDVRRSGRRPAMVAVEPWRRPEVASAIACSGGGVRSSAFALGALSALQDTPGQDPDSSHGLLGEADVLATVSGGGYAGGSWRMAAGTGPLSGNAHIGNPESDIEEHTNRYPESAFRDAGPASRDLYPFVRRRRDYLRNGRGGLLVSGLEVAWRLAIHLSIIIVVVAGLAWPLGRLTSSWVVADTTRLSSGDVGFVVRAGLVAPAAVPLAMASVALLLRMFTLRDAKRQVLDVVAAALVGGAAAIALPTLIMPVTVDRVVPFLEQWLVDPVTTTLYLFALGGGLGAVFFRSALGIVRTRMSVLGGIGLALGLLVWAIFVAGRAATVSGFFGFGWRYYVVGLIIGAAALIGMNPDWWSIHSLYRSLLGQTFSTTVGFDGTRRARKRRFAEHPVLSAYQSAEGPMPLICCAAARSHRAQTGIPAISFTFDPHHVVLHRWNRTTGRAESFAIPTDDYERLVDGRWRRHYLTALGAVALSGAAVSPSLGRLDLGSTNTLLAALNVRLGAWLPNPAKAAGLYSRREWGRPRLDNMASEMVGNFDEMSDNLYVADGGHWDNLGLVEVIRRKPKIIVCVDASADDRLETLLDSIELARLECEATVVIPQTEWDRITAGSVQHSTGDLPASSWCFGSVEYADSAEPGLLIYVKSQLSRETPLKLLRYAKEDAVFPRYPTADQFLTDRAFHHLALLGRVSMTAALAGLADLEHDRVTAGTREAAEPAIDLSDGASVVSGGGVALT